MSALANPCILENRKKISCPCDEMNNDLFVATLIAIIPAPHVYMNSEMCAGGVKYPSPHLPVILTLLKYTG
jgi:hypothetical protein